MQSTIDTFTSRISEINLFFNALEELYLAKQASDANLACYSDDFLKILKSNALIMVYNLVESSIMGGILEIYDEVHTQGLTYNNVRQEIKSIWFAFMFNQVYKKNAHYQSYMGKAQEIINSILDGDILYLDRKATDYSGNLDAQKIRQICSDHGIQYSVSSECNGGIALLDVKNKRNELAHGSTSFVECGRDYTIDDLTRIKNQTVIFLEGILDGMKSYFEQQKYRL